MTVDLLAERAAEAARRILQERARRHLASGRAFDAAAFAFLVAVWVVGYCLLCSPAHAATLRGILPDEGLTRFLCFAPLVTAAILIFWALWTDHGAAPDAGEDHMGEAPVFRAPELNPPPRPVAPPTVPALATLVAPLREDGR